jgi:hypothetical protein
MWYLHKHASNKGWLRQLEARLTGRVVVWKTPNDDEKNLALKLYLCLRSNIGSADAIASAWGVRRQTIYEWKKKVDESPTMEVARKPRKDTGQTIFTSDSRRNATYTERKIGPHRVVAAPAKEGESISHAQAVEAYALASPEYKAETAALTLDFQQRAIFLLAELKCVFSKTNGSISWSNLERSLNNGEDGAGAKLVSATTIRHFITSTPGFSYKTTRILPFLSKGYKEKRYNWSMEFWLFWEGAKAFEGIQVLLVQMDEKWCYGVVVRKNEKSVPFFRIEPLVHGVQHKSHIDKSLITASTGFLPIDNDMEAGGASILVGLQRAGRMVIAERSTFKRVYNPDGSGSYTYPKLPKNVLREKGKEYFQGMEITGPYAGTAKRPKYPLTEFFADEMERLGVLAQEIGAHSGKRVVAIRWMVPVPIEMGSSFGT